MLVLKQKFTISQEDHRAGSVSYVIFYAALPEFDITDHAYDSISFSM